MSIDGTSAFGVAASEYDLFRPGYPAQVVARTLYELGIIGTASSAVDIGCGTGKFSAVLKGLGIRVSGVEPDMRMASVARRSHGVPVHISTFEAWQPSTGYDLLTCAQAWHWLTPGLRSRKAHECLRADGHLLLAWNLPANPDQVDEQLSCVYREVLAGRWEELDGEGSRQAPIDVDAFADELADSGFTGLNREVTLWPQVYSGQQWCGLLSTTSSHQRLDDRDRSELFAAIADHVDRELSGTVAIEYKFIALSGRRHGLGD
jgi:trans-aconitate methyltransferase